MDQPKPPVAPPADHLSSAEAVIFSCKAAVSAVAALYAYGLFDMPGAIWAPISAVIVTQPKLHPSFKLSVLRVAANLIGAFIGAAVSAAFGHTVVAMAVGVVLTGLVCCFARLDDAVRPAYAAVVIVTLSGESRVWAGSLDRVMGVTIGCVVALAVGLVFDYASQLFSRGENKTQDGK